jgi:hypothetical protein
MRDPKIHFLLSHSPRPTESHTSISHFSLSYPTIVAVLADEKNDEIKIESATMAVPHSKSVIKRIIGSVYLEQRRKSDQSKFKIHLSPSLLTPYLCENANTKHQRDGNNDDDNNTV